MDKSAFQLFKNTDRTNTNAWLHSVPLIDFGRVIKVIDMQTVVVEAAVQTSLAKETYTVTLLSLSSALLELSDEPKVGDTVLLLFLRKHHPLMFMSEPITDRDATGYNKFSGVGVLMAAAKNAAHTLISCYDDNGKAVTDITSDAEVYGTCNNLVAIEFCRAVFNSQDEQAISLIFGAGRPLVEKHLARVEREYGFWKDPEGALVALDASVTERYSLYAPITKDIQGAQTYTVGVGEDGDTEAPVSVTLGESADVTITSKSALTAEFDKTVSVSSASVSLELMQNGKVYVGNSETDLCTVLLGVIDQIAALSLIGDASVNPAWTTQMQAQKTVIQTLLSAANSAAGG
jgi:hypothetical protein